MHLAFNRLTFFTYQASDFNNWEKVRDLLCFHHTQWEVFFQIIFHPRMKFYSFHPEMKFTCKQKFCHPGASCIPGWDFISVTCQCTIRGCFQVKFHPGMKSSLSMVKCLLCLMSLNVSFIVGWKTGMKKGEKTCKHFIPGWNFKMSMFF